MIRITGFLLFLALQLAGQGDEPLLYDSFDRAAYNPLWCPSKDDTGWLGPWVREIGDDAILRRGNLMHPDFIVRAAGTHASLAFVRSGVRYNRNFTSIPDDGDTLWLSILIDFLPTTEGRNVGNLTLNSNGQQVLSFGRKFGSSLIGLAGPGIGRFDSNVRAEGPHWLVGRIDFSGDGGQEDFYLWIDPDPTTVPDPAKADITVPASASPGLSLNTGFDQLQLKVEGNPPLTVLYDELKAGRSFSAIAPGQDTSVAVMDKIALPELSFRYYPNPVRNQLYIERLDGGQVGRITLYDEAGRQVFEGEYRSGLGISSLATGVYSVAVRGLDGRRGTFRIVKQ